MPYNLPSYEQQQAIKQDTENILANFPINGGTDFHSFTPMFILAQPASEYSFNTILQVSGKGILSNINSISYSVKTKITIDGVVVIPNLTVQPSGNASLLIPFKTSLKVEVQQFGANKPDVGVSYLIG